MKTPKIWLGIFCAMSLATTPAMAMAPLKCPYVAPNEPVSQMTCSDLAATNQVAPAFGVMFRKYAEPRCGTASPPMFIPVPNRVVCEATNRVIFAVNQAATYGQQPPVPSDWEARWSQLLDRIKENNSRYEMAVRDQASKQQQQRDAIIGVRKNDSASFERVLTTWKNNTNLEDRKYATLTAWWSSLGSNPTFSPTKVALTTCIDWVWLQQRMNTSRKPAAMVLEPLFEQCYSNEKGVAAIPLEKVEAVFSELRQSGYLPAAEADTWKKGFMGQSTANFQLLQKVADARREQKQQEMEVARFNALSPEQKAAKVAERRAAEKSVHERNCANYKSAYEFSYRGGDAKGAANALGAMKAMGCI